MVRSIVHQTAPAYLLAMLGFLPVCSCKHQQVALSHPASVSGTRPWEEPGPTCPSPARGREPHYDSAITAAVERQFRRDPGIEQGKIWVATQAGIVQLTGTVNDLLSKQRAWRVAQTVRGVRAVSDRVEVRVPDREDAQIERDVASAWTLNAATVELPVRASSRDGVVTLTGTAGSWQEEQLAERVAMGVRGVRSVDNRIEVKYLAERSDPEIRADIESRLRWDALLDHRLLSVRVDDGAVQLAGHVGTAAEKWRASADAWVNGVKSVDETRIDVRPWAERSGLVTRHYPRLSDQEIVRAIEDAARYDPRVDPSAIEAEVRAGFVTLRGIVDNLQAKRAAGTLARHTVGVVQVENLVEVRSQVPLTDLERARRIRAALAIDPVTQPAQIEVEVVKGSAILTGAVENHYVAAEADRVAAGVHGISQVNDRLRVARTSVGYAHRRSIGPFGSHSESWASAAPLEARRGDDEIACDIQHELVRSALVDPDDVSVRVHDGAATLTGTVESWRQRSAASDRALEAGATAVYNGLQVK